MGNVIINKMDGMSRWMKSNLVLFIALATAVSMLEGLYNPKTADAAITQVTGFTNVYHSATLPGATVASFPVNVGSNRMLVVALSYQSSSSAALTGTSVTYGGVAMSLASGNFSTSLSMHTGIYFLKENAVMDGTAKTLAVSITGGGTSVMNNVWYAVYSGVDQAATPTVQTFNSGSGTVTTAAFATGLAVAANGQAVLVAVGSRATSAVTYTKPINFTVTNNQVQGTTGVGLVAIRTIPGTSTTDTAGFTAITGGPRWSQTGMSMAAAVVSSDSTPPIAGAVTITPDVSGTFTSLAPTITTTFTDAESAVSSCEYTTNGSTWAAGVVSGASSPYTCTANPTALTGLLNINMRATSAGGGPASATQIQRTVDSTIPIDGILTITAGNAQNSLSWTAASDPGGSGIASYALRYATGASAPSDCASGTAIAGSPFLPSVLSITHTGLTNGTQYSYRLCATDGLSNISGGVTGSRTPSATLPVATITSCNGCHGYTTTFVDGTTRNAPVGRFPGSHNGHVIANSNACSVCHTVPATTTSADFNHADGTIAMAGSISGGSYAKGSSWAATDSPTAFTACSSTTCHGASSPTWGSNTSQAVCTKCHGVNNTTPAAYTADPNTAAPGYLTTGRGTGGATAATDVKVGAHDTHLRGLNNISNPIACGECHSNVNTTNASFIGHMNGAGTVTFGTLANTNSATSAYTSPNCTATYCHFGKPNGAYTPATANAAVAWTDTAYLVGTTADCQKCHLSPPSNTGTHAGKVFPADCNACHPHVSITGVITDKTKHINGVVDGSGVSAGGSPCYGCHGAYNVMNGSTSFFHHVLNDAAPDQAPNAGIYPSSQTVLACTSCHTDHNYTNLNKGANLRTSYNAAAGTRDNHDFSTTAPYGLCVSCHNTAQTKNTAQTVAGTAATIVIDGSATGFQASMHNYTASSLFGTSQFSANCVKCHTDEQAKDKQTTAAPDKFGPHFSVQRSLLNPMGATPQAAAGADFCYRCHHKVGDVNPGGGIAKNTALKDYFGSKAMTAAAEDIFSAMQQVNRHNVSSYKGLHKDDETLIAISATKHVECTDCHDPHLAKSGTHTVGSATLPGVLTGAAGVTTPTWPANWTAPAQSAYAPGGNVSANLSSATAEWQICFKCHSGANSNVATWGGTLSAAFTDLGLEFNPNNASGHPIVSALPVANRLTAARLTGGWVPGSVMTCTDCHDSDSAASKGPHGSSVKWMLTGTNKAWPYTTAAGNGGGTGTLYRIATYNTGAGTADGLFCLNCHTIRPATGVNNWHSNSNVTAGQHGGNAIMACASCHIRVPHGGKISRLLQTVNAPVRYRPNGSSGTASWDFWGTSTVNIKGSAFASGNFNSSCGQHNSGGTGGEAW